MGERKKRGDGKSEQKTGKGKGEEKKKIKKEAKRELRARGKRSFYESYTHIHHTSA